MTYANTSGEWIRAVVDAWIAGRIHAGTVATAAAMSVGIRWTQHDGARWDGHPALYWSNEKFCERYGINLRTFERHRAALRREGLLETLDGNVVPLLAPVTADGGAPTPVSGHYKGDSLRDTLPSTKGESKRRDIEVPSPLTVPEPVRRYCKHGKRIPALIEGGDYEYMCAAAWGSGIKDLCEPERLTKEAAQD